VLDDAALTGPVGAFVHEAAPFTEADPAALFVSVLVALGVVAGGSAHVDAGNARQTGGVFALIVAETPTGNRGLSWAVTRALLDVVDPWVARARVLAGLGNGKAVLDALVSPPPPWATRLGEAARHPAPGADERLLVFEPAFTRALAVAARPTSPLAWVIRSAWDGHPLDLPARRHRLVVERHHIGIVAHATADQLRSQLSMTGPGVSFASRFLMVLAARRHYLVDEGNVPQDVLLRHGRSLASALEAVHDVGLMARTLAAAERRVVLPQPLVHLANRPHGRYRLGCPVTFSYRGEEVAARAATGAVRYDISCAPAKGRWYIDASWKCSPPGVRDLDQLPEQRVVAVDLNKDRLAAMVVDPSGNPVGRSVTIPLDLTDLPAPTRDGHLRQPVSVLLDAAKADGCQAVVIEDLDFEDARELGRERTGNRPSRGKSAKSFRRTVSGLPTARFRDRLVQMAANAGLSVIAVDPVYTSQWGATHWLCPLQKISVDASGHHAAALVIARRGLGQRARQRRRCDSTCGAWERESYPSGRAVHGRRAGGGPVRATKEESRDPQCQPGTPNARGQPHLRRKTRPAERSTPVDQVTQDRSGPPTRRDPVPLSV